MSALLSKWISDPDLLPRAADQDAARLAAERWTEAADGTGDPADAEFFSPFEEDELDVPTFLRRGNKDDEEEDSDEPAFLRRSAD